MRKKESSRNLNVDQSRSSPRKASENGSHSNKLKHDEYTRYLTDPSLNHKEKIEIIQALDEFLTRLWGTDPISLPSKN